jgi:SAM-dependent methyltransferase
MNSKSVKTYFDSISSNYKDRYNKGRLFHNHFFRRRLEYSVKNENFNHKKILDIGAGSGELYHYIKKANVDYRYTAVDISARMMIEGGIPEELQFVGNVYDIENDDKYDFIYMLGVTSYLNSSEMNKIIQYIVNHSKKESTVIISFALKNTIPSFISNLQTLVLSLPLLNKFGNNISFSGISLEQTDMNTIETIHPSLQIKSLFYHNQTISPLNHIVTKPSIAFEGFLNNFFGNSKLKIMSTDVVVKYIKIN